MLPSDDSGMSLADYRVRVDNRELELWSDSVPRIEIESHKVTATDVVVTTTDTVCHSDDLGAWLESRSSLILCGPPGSGTSENLFDFEVRGSYALNPSVCRDKLPSHDAYQRITGCARSRLGKPELLISFHSRNNNEDLCAGKRYRVSILLLPALLF